MNEYNTHYEKYKNYYKNATKKQIIADTFTDYFKLITITKWCEEAIEKQEDLKELVECILEYIERGN